MRIIDPSITPGLGLTARLAASVAADSAALESAGIVVDLVGFAVGTAVEVGAGFGDIAVGLPGVGGLFACSWRARCSYVEPRPWDQALPG